MPLVVIDGRAERAGQRCIRDAEVRKMKMLSFEKEFLGPDKNGRCNLAALAVGSFARNEGTFHDDFQSGRNGRIVQPCWNVQNLARQARSTVREDIG